MEQIQDWSLGNPASLTGNLILSRQKAIYKASDI